MAIWKSLRSFSRLLQRLLKFFSWLRMFLEGKKKSELQAWDPSIFWQKVDHRVTVLAAPRASC